MFADMEGGQLPLISRVVFGFSDWMLGPAIHVCRTQCWILIGCVVTWMGFAAWTRTKKGRVIVDSSEA